MVSIYRGHQSVHDKPTTRHDSSPRIVISNVYSDDNRGSAALTQASLDAVSRAFPNRQSLFLVSIREFADKHEQFRHTTSRNPEIHVLQPLTETSGRLGGIWAFVGSILCLWGVRTRRVRAETYQAITSADVVVSRGGVIFWQRHQAAADTLGLGITTFPLRLAMRRGIPVAIYGAHIGPLPKRAARFVAGKTRDGPRCGI